MRSLGDDVEWLVRESSYGEHEDHVIESQVARVLSDIEITFICRSCGSYVRVAILPHFGNGVSSDLIKGLLMFKEEFPLPCKEQAALNAARFVVEQ